MSNNMEASNSMLYGKNNNEKKVGIDLTAQDKLALGHMKYAQGLGASLRFANELRAVQQVGRLPFLKSSHLHEDVLRGNLGAGNGFKDAFGEQEETSSSRLAFL